MFINAVSPGTERRARARKVRVRARVNVCVRVYVGVCARAVSCVCVWLRCRCQHIPATMVKSIMKNLIFSGANEILAISLLCTGAW